MRKDLFFCEAKKGCHSLVFSKKKRCIFFQRKKNVSKKNEHIFKDVRKEWGDYLETGGDKINKNKFEIEKYDSDDLLECYNEWREKEKNDGIHSSYQIAVKLFKKYKIPFLSEKEINEFAGALGERHFYNGIFSSAMINELYQGGEIHLGSNDVGYIGCYNKNKKIVVEGDCDNYIGREMEGGEIVVEGDCEDWIGEYMEGGEIIVEGDCSNSIGWCMSGGKIKIYGNNFNPKEQISKYAKKGEIYRKDELVWKDGEFMGGI